MSQTISYSITNSEDVLKSLKTFDESEPELAKIKELSNISDHSLKPEDFYEGVQELDLNGFQSFKVDFIDTIDEISKYIKTMDAINSGVLTGSFGKLHGALVPLPYLSKLGNGGTFGNSGSSSTDGGYNYKSSNLNDGNEKVSDLINQSNINNTSNNQINNLQNSGILDSGIIEQITDISGNVVAVSVAQNGKKKWLQVSNGNVIVPKDDIKIFNIPKDITITVNGVETIIPSGNYDINQVIYNSDGSIKSVRVMCGDYKTWLHLDSNGNIIKVEYILGKNGVFTINNANFDITDMYGNNIGKFQSGEYFIYETLFDDKGNAIELRLSPDGEYEKWIYPNGNTVDGNYSFFDTIQKSQGTNLSLFDQNKSLFGVLGVLFVALGTTVVIRKKVKDKENSNNNSYNYESDIITEDSLDSGNYGIYDVKRNEDGIVTEARINPLDSDDEYWVEV